MNAPRSVFRLAVLTGCGDEGRHPRRRIANPPAMVRMIAPAHLIVLGRRYRLPAAGRTGEHREHGAEMLGTTIGNYAIDRKIGEGGMGAVFLARHTMLGRLAAVKVLLPELSRDREIVGRFFNEARAATSIRHPGIVEVFDFGYLPDTSAYIIMEFLDGESLASRIRGGTLTPDGALTIVRQICGVLDAAHRQGIVHRDLKPDNVFLVRDPEMAGGERVKLLDFGIAKLAADAGGETSRTRTGAVMGTPMYMSPEQGRGAGAVDHRADLYALGCILFEMSCGRPPFVAEGAGDIIAHHLYFQPQAPSAVRAGVPPAIDRLTLWLLQKDPAARPASAAELIGAIDAAGPRASTPGTATAYTTSPPPLLSTQSMTTLSGAAGAGAGSPGRASSGARRWWIAGGALTVAAAVVLLLVLLGGSEDKKPPLPPAAAALVEPVAPAPAPAPAPAAAPPVAEDPAPPAPSPPPAPPASVEMFVESNPPGAEVVLDGKVVGVTPLTVEQAPSQPPRTYTLRKRGYDRAKVEFVAGGKATVALRKQTSRTGGGGVGVNPFE